ncbi:MAG: protein-disulfide reductase DsbD [Thiofilum sp.]|uniref:protein-disulfide reductase DsbD n=1 Tax=Thiofilum sp. TaxID=2212733 RepID=UPI0025D592F9|nr:protein-disulfide reductase DsbD [Thiofilum sp.]MBK8453803.1 protein-disulfide reductase DsbD [Thiofilum sp.]
MLTTLRLILFTLLCIVGTNLAANNLFSNGLFSSNTVGDEVLDVDQAFKIKPPIYDGKKIIVGWDIAPEYYLYREKFQLNLLEAKGFSAGELAIPEGKVKQDPAFGTVQALYNQVEINLPLNRVDNQAASFLLEVMWQGCFEKLGVCYPPERKGYLATAPALQAGQTMDANDLVFNETTLPDPNAEPTRASASTTPSATDSTNTLATPMLSETNRIANLLADGKIPWIMLSFLGFGLLLSFTPCVFPMIPILSGIIAGQKNLTTHKAFLLSLTYVLAMASTYTVVGLLAGLFGGNLQATFQNPWVVSAFALVFVLLALSMFGFYDLQIPNSWQTKINQLSNQQQGGTLIGVAIMGILSALIVGPCVAAPLAGALMYISQTGNALLGGLALFSLSIGMGIPLLLIGTSAGKWLPRAGAWMDAVKAIFGVLLLAVALYLLERVLPATVYMLLWGLLFIITAVYMGAVTPLANVVSNWAKLWKGLAIALLMQGTLILIGGALGSNDIVNPLRQLTLAQAQHNEVSFQRVTNLEQFNQALASAKGKPVLLDFYADWCISCKEMEKYTFTDPSVQAQLANFVLLQIDVTKNTADDKAFLKHFKLMGPPAILFFDSNGKEHREWQQIGFIKPQPFATHLAQIK